MKKITILSMIFVALSLMSFSCTKDDDDTTNAITVNDLVGDWNFQSLTYNGVVYDTEAELFELDKTCSYIQLSFLDVTTTEIGLLDHRGAPSPYHSDYTLINNTINFDNGAFVYKIENWDTFNDTVLKLKLISSIFDNDVPIGGIYTMVK